MKRNKKAFIALVITVVTVFLAGTITATYAWFLSRFTREYDFILQSDSPVILKYESQLEFLSGDIDTPENLLIPATAKATVGIEQQALAPLDMFDVDVQSPAHTGKVQSAAQAAAFTASGAYWTGETTTVGEFSFEMKAFLTEYAEEQYIDDESLSTFSSDGHELVNRGELDCVVIFDYLGYDILYYDGSYYLNTEVAAGAVTTFDFLGLDGEYNWHLLVAFDTVSYNDGNVQIYDGTYLLLQPNTTFSFTMYAFVAKTDEELDPEINGQGVTLYATIKLH